MKHLSRAEFVDLIESPQTLSSDCVRHLEACVECREEAATLRTMRALAADDPASEPSPLFWNHFSAGVSERLRGEPAPVAPARWIPGSFGSWAAVGTLATLLITTALWRTTVHAPAPTNSSPAVPAVALQGVEPEDDVEGDEAWAVVRAAAANLEWEEADEAGIAAHPSDVENVALQLTPAERVELARLLEADLKRNGA